MKNILIYATLLLFIGCNNIHSSAPAEIAQIVVESFYQGDEITLKEHTTEEGYANLKSIMGMFAKSKNTDSNFKVLGEAVEDEVAWVKYTTSYDKTPGIFKLVKDDGAWKITARRPGEKVPFD